jgi:DNA-binding MarR family transcriptional regulator
MNQLNLPLARVTDPQTSWDAASKSDTFRARHISLIWTCLKDHGAMIPREIAAKTGLEYHAVQRRGKQMERDGLIVRGPEIKNGQTVWRVK